MKWSVPAYEFIKAPFRAMRKFCSETNLLHFEVALEERRLGADLPLQEVAVAEPRRVGAQNLQAVRVR